MRLEFIQTMVKNHEQVMSYTSIVRVSIVYTARIKHLFFYSPFHANIVYIQRKIVKIIIP